jgi:hypothetical protein
MKTQYSSIKKAKKGIVDPSDNTPKYESNNFDLQYHDTVDVINSQTDVPDASSGTAFVLDNCGNMVTLPPIGLGITPTYYQPGSYRFGASTYVPTYEDSIYLSKTSGESSVTSISNIATNSKGFCSKYLNEPNKLEEACMNTDVNSCASTSCCVLLGGSKCVSGNKQGPYMKQNYGDVTILNRDYYYYKGKCYGNCPETNIYYTKEDINPNTKFMLNDRLDQIDSSLNLSDNSSNIIDSSSNTNATQINSASTSIPVTTNVNDITNSNALMPTSVSTPTAPSISNPLNGVPVASAIPTLSVQISPSSTLTIPITTPSAQTNTTTPIN